MKERTLYEVLMLHPTATIEVINAVYRTLAKQHHPDHAGPEGATTMARINEAYAVLSERYAADADDAGDFPGRVLRLHEPNEGVAHRGHRLPPVAGFFDLFFKTFTGIQPFESFILVPELIPIFFPVFQSARHHVA